MDRLAARTGHLGPLGRSRAPSFVKVFPTEYKRALGVIHAKSEAGATIAKARTDASSQSVPAK